MFQTHSTLTPFQVLNRNFQNVPRTFFDEELLELLHIGTNFEFSSEWLGNELSQDFSSVKISDDSGQDVNSIILALRNYRRKKLLNYYYYLYWKTYPNECNDQCISYRMSSLLSKMSSKPEDEKTILVIDEFHADFTWNEANMFCFSFTSF